MAKLDGDTFEENKRKTAKRLLAYGNISDETIMLISGLSEEKLEELKTEE